MDNGLVHVFLSLTRGRAKRGPPAEMVSVNFPLPTLKMTSAALEEGALSHPLVSVSLARISVREEASLVAR